MLKNWMAYGGLMLAFLASTGVGSSQTSTPFYRLRDIRVGQRGSGRTVFAGGRIDQFQVEVLGVLENIGPHQSIILARLTGGPLADTGILQGMSGSPVYLDGKLAGAVALGFPFSKEAIAGIQPIEQMIADAEAADQGGGPATARRRLPEPVATWFAAAASDAESGLWTGLVKQAGVLAADPAGPPVAGRLRPLATPLSLNGFTEHALQRFSSAFQRLGFEPAQAFGAGTPQVQRYTGTVQPGSMISVQLMTGDLSVSAEGTVTYVDGKRVYAFGHRFLDTGTTDLPFARAEVLALLPNVSTSFKISAAKEWVGTIVSDRSTAVAGEIGRPAQLVPLTIRVRHNSSARTYHMQVVSDRLLTPFLTQTALFSTVDATERTLGAGTLRLKGRVEFAGNAPPLVLNNTFASDANVAAQAALTVAVPFSFALQAGFAQLHPRAIEFDLAPDEAKRQLNIEQIWASRREVRPGETVTITGLFSGEDGVSLTRALSYQVPPGAAAGPLSFTLSDANTLNFPELANLSPTTARTPQQLLGLLNGIRVNDRAYLRVWRSGPTYPLPGADLTDPPPSIGMILARTAGGLAGNLFAPRGSGIAELALDVDGYVIGGSKTIQLEVKE